MIDTQRNKKQTSLIGVVQLVMRRDEEIVLGRTGLAWSGQLAPRIDAKLATG